MNIPTYPGRETFEAHARNTDPETSHAAAHETNAQRLEKIVLEYLATHGPSNTKEIAAGTETRLVSISPRMAPLKRKGLVRLTGERRDRAQVWELRAP